MNDINIGLSKDKEVKLKHVKVYDQLYEAIQNETYPIGSQLPSEPELALQMGVSRMTLRRALSLLQEDNLIHNIRGKGNFIKDHHTAHSATLSSDLHSITNPMDFCSNSSWSNIEMEFRIEPPSDFINKAVGGNSVAVVIADRWYMKEETNETAIGYTLSFIPIEMMTKYQINLNEESSLLDYMQTFVYNDSSASHATFSHTTTGNFTSTKYALADMDSFILVLETIYDTNGEIMICNKHFIPIENFYMQLSTSKK